MRDEELLWWLSRFKFIPRDVLCEIAQIGWSRLRRRLAPLRKEGLVDVFEHPREPNAVYLTSAGYRKIGLPPRRPASFHGAHYEKEHAAVLYAVRRERSLESYERLYSQRDMRAMQKDTGEELGVRTRQPVGEHWPVLSVLGTEGYIYVEIVLGLKHFGDLQRILRGYNYADQVTTVLYLVSTAQIARQVKRAGDRVGGSRKLEIKPWIELAEPEVKAVETAAGYRAKPELSTVDLGTVKSNGTPEWEDNTRPYTPPIPPPWEDLYG